MLKVKYDFYTAREDEAGGEATLRLAGATAETVAAIGAILAATGAFSEDNEDVEYALIVPVIPGRKRKPVARVSEEAYIALTDVGLTFSPLPDDSGYALVPIR